MSQLILINRTYGYEIGRRAMDPHERFTYYLAQGAQIQFQGACYRLNTVAWRLPDENCILGVTAESSAEAPYCED